MKNIMPEPWILNGLTIVGPKLPWEGQEPQGIKRIDSYIVATVEHGEDGNYRHYPRRVAYAHAHAIRALPQMIAALETCVEALGRYDGECSPEGDAFAAARYALAQAKEK